MIDDRIALKKDWVDAGGIFVHHINTETTIQKLIGLGVLSKDKFDDEEKNWYWEAGSWSEWTPGEAGSTKSKS